MKEYMELLNKYLKTIFPNHFEDIIRNIKAIRIESKKRDYTRMYINFLKFQNVKYKLVKTLNPSSVTFIKRPKELDINDYTEVTINDIDEMFEEHVINFVNVLEENFPKEQLLYMYRNLRDLKIMTKELVYAAGDYTNSLNRIRLRKDSIDRSIDHELFHMATAIKTKEGTYCGFRVIPKNKIELGTALNEGYTEIMTNRYFNHEDYISSGYAYQIGVCKEIEDIVGQDTMQKLYMELNLKGLIDELSKYATPFEVTDFIKKTDEILFITREKDHNYLTKDGEEKLNDVLDQDRIDVRLFLNTLKIRKEKNDKNIPVPKDDNYPLYLMNNKPYKKIYASCLELLHVYSNELKENPEDSIKYYDIPPCIDYIFEAIGYDKVEEVCLNGLTVLEDELRKYLDKRGTDYLFNLLNGSEKKITHELEEKIRKVLYFNVLNKGVIQLPITCGFDKLPYDLTDSYIYHIKDARVNNGKGEEEIGYLENIIGRDRLYYLFIMNKSDELIEELKKHRSEEFVDEIINAKDEQALRYAIIKYAHNKDYDSIIKGITIPDDPKYKELYTYNNKEYKKVFRKLYVIYSIYTNSELSEDDKNGIFYGCPYTRYNNFYHNNLSTEKLTSICTSGGIREFVEELKKYLGVDTIDYLDLLNKNGKTYEDFTALEGYREIMLYKYLDDLKNPDDRSMK